MVLLLLGVIVVVVLILAVIFLTYNGLIAKRNRVQDAWAQIDVQLKRRFDLIPNLIETVKGYMKYEKNVLTTITSLRSQLVSGSVQDKAQANNMLSQALKSLFAVAENYPDLKASQTFQNLQMELENTENKIAFVRTSYNDYVLDYNNAIQQFPGLMFAGPMHFSRQDFFKTPDEERGPVKVDFSDVNLDSGPTAPAAKPQKPAAPAPPQKGKK
jgi:LemA protein